MLSIYFEGGAMSYICRVCLLASNHHLEQVVATSNGSHINYYLVTSKLQMCLNKIYIYIKKLI